MIGAPVTPDNMRYAGAWQQAEGGNAAFNPFNTTQPSAGASNYNSVGVKNYGSLQEGLHATAQTLLNGHYNKLVADLRSGKASAMQLAQDEAATPWGTGPLIEKVLGGKVTIPNGATAGGSSQAGIQAHLATAPQGTSMRDALLGLVMQNNQALMSGQVPGPQNPLELLTALRGGGGQSPQGQILGAQGANGAAGMALPQAKPGSVVAAAHSMLGTPYVWGGNSPGKALDCSGFIQQSYAKIGVQLPRTTYDQFKHGQAVGLKDLQPGDAVFVEPGKNGPNHVGMYVGNGMVQESPHTGTRNSLIPLKAFLGDGYVGSRRYVKS